MLFDKKMTALMEQIAALKGVTAAVEVHHPEILIRRQNGITPGGNDQKTDGTTSRDENQENRWLRIRR